MSNYTKHLYAIMYPNHSLVASQLEPAEFGKHYSVGSARYYTGKMLFAEVDLAFRNPYFDVDRYLDLTVEHPDGSPKHTKFISSYRVLEHLDLGALKSLYATTPSGVTLEIPRGEGSESAGPRLKIIQELNPLQLLIASTYDHRSFGAYMTDPGNPRGTPKLFYAQLELNVEAFREEWDRNPFMAPPIPGVHPQKLKAVIDTLLADPQPRTKSIGIQSVFDKVTYRSVEGFWFVDGERLLHYPMPSEKELQARNFQWWRSMA